MHERETKPIWTSSTFLVYTGGLTVLGGGLGALGYLATQYRGHGQETGWALLIYVILFAIAYVLRRRDRSLAAGIFAFSSVIAWIVLVALAFTWWGWTNSTSANSFRDWSWARLAFELLVIAAAVDARRRFRFPFIRLISAGFGYLFVIDVLTKGSGNSLLIVTLIIGLLYLAVGTFRAKPSTFWLHLVAGFLIGVPILVWCHTTDFDFAVVSFMSLVYVAWAQLTKRSSWAVLGTIGFFIATVHYLVGSPTSLAEQAAGLSGGNCAPTAIVCPQAPHISIWSFPLGFGLLGFWLVLLGMLGRRRHRAVEVSVAVTPAE